MDTSKLRYFCVVAKVGSIRQASEFLSLSSAALSKSIKSLEEELGVRLIIASGRGINITLEGRRFAAKAETLLADFDHLKDSVKSRSVPEGLLKLGAFEVFSTYFLGSLIEKYFPRQLFILHDLAPGHLEQALYSGEIDYGITYVPTQTSGIEHTQVTKIEMGVFGLDKSFSSIPFDKIPFAIPVIPIHGAPTKVEGSDGWPEGKIGRNIKYRVTLMESALELCRRGLAAAYLPKFIAALHNERVQASSRIFQLSTAPAMKLPLQPVYLASREGENDTVVARNLARAIRVTCQAMPSS